MISLALVVFDVLAINLAYLFASGFGLTAGVHDPGALSGRLDAGGAGLYDRHHHHLCF